MSRSLDMGSWAEANQALLAAELARLRRRLDVSGPDVATGVAGDATKSALDAAVADAADAMPAPSAIDWVAKVFGLSTFERELLLLCCGVELDSALADACARLHGNDARRNASFGLALSKLSQPHWTALTPGRPLRRWRLVDVDAGPRLVDGPLRVDERILHFVAGVNDLDVRLRPLLIEPDAPRLMAENHARLVDSLATRLQDERRTAALLHFDGNDDSGQQDIAVALADRLGHRLFVMQADNLPPGQAELEQVQTLWEREARLLPAILLLKRGGSTNEQAFASFVERAEASLFVASQEPLQLKRACHPCTVDKPDPAEQKQLWLHALGDTAQRLNGSLDILAGQFRLSAQAISTIVDSVASADSEADADHGLWQACRSIGRERLEDLADRIEPMAGWDDLILPEGQQGTLHQVAAHVRQRIRVYEDWGFARQGTRGLGHERAVLRRKRHRQDHGGRSAGQRTAGSISTASTCRPWSASTSAKPRRTCAASSTPPRTAARSCCSTRPTRCSASAARSRTATTATPTSRSATCCNAWRPIAAWPS